MLKAQHLSMTSLPVDVDGDHLMTSFLDMTISTTKNALDFVSLPVVQEGVFPPPPSASAPPSTPSTPSLIIRGSLKRKRQEDRHDYYGFQASHDKEAMTGKRLRMEQSAERMDNGVDSGDESHEDTTATVEGCHRRPKEEIKHAAPKSTIDSDENMLSKYKTSHRLVATGAGKLIAEMIDITAFGYRLRMLGLNCDNLLHWAWIVATDDRMVVHQDKAMCFQTIFETWCRCKHGKDDALICLLFLLGLQCVRQPHAEASSSAVSKPVFAALDIERAISRYLNLDERQTYALTPLEFFWSLLSRQEDGAEMRHRQYCKSIWYSPNACIERLISEGCG